MEAFRHCWGMSAPTGRIDLPDSEIASAAKQFVYDVSPAFVAHHSLRSYLYGRELAAAKGLRPGVDYDDELVFLSCILHDLGVTEHANGDQRFEVDGADAAAQFLRTGSVPNRPSLSWASPLTSWASTSTSSQRVTPNKRTNPGRGTTSVTRWPTT